MIKKFRITSIISDWVNTLALEFFFMQFIKAAQNLSFNTDDRGLGPSEYYRDMENSLKNNPDNNFVIYLIITNFATINR